MGFFARLFGLSKKKTKARDVPATPSSSRRAALVAVVARGDPPPRRRVPASRRPSRGTKK